MNLSLEKTNRWTANLDELTSIPMSRDFTAARKDLKKAVRPRGVSEDLR